MSGRGGDAKVIARVDLVKHALTIGLAAFIVYELFQTINAGFHADPKNVSAMAKFFDHFKVPEILEAIATLIFGGVALVYRTTNKALKAENKRLNDLIETLLSKNNKQKGDMS